MTSIDVPTSYETFNLTHIQISHHPSGASEATPVVIFTLNRPEKHNAFTPQMADSLTQAYKMVHVDPRVKVVVLTGAGRMFCAGSDLDIGFGNGQGRAVDFRDIGGRVALAMHRCHKPTIVAMNGSAVGVEQVRLRFHPTWLDHRILRIVFLATSGRLFACHAADHHRWRLPPTSQHFGDLFTEILSDAGAILPRGLELAQEIAENVSPLASSMSRALMWEGAESPEAAHLLESRVFHHMIGQRDYQEGVRSFLEKRKPRFESDLRETSSPNYPWWPEVDITREASISKHRL
ncbi:Enoyl-CoA hydratase AKT3-1 [Penicillium sp. IBT 35674x]|nr:Enoyl-CoA hydratase AKT3-1 [Penicillium sp. IBT 35674x]